MMLEAVKPLSDVSDFTWIRQQPLVTPTPEPLQVILQNFGLHLEPFLGNACHT